MSNGPVFEAKPGWSAWVNANKLWLLPVVAVVIVIIIVIVIQDGSGIVTEQTGSPIPTTVLQTGMASQTVVARDNYTLVARRMITAGTPGQRLYAETILQSQLRNQPLTAGSTISIETSKIQAILDSYATLFPSQRTKWEAMAKNVKF